MLLVSSVFCPDWCHFEIETMPSCNDWTWLVPLASFSSSFAKHINQNSQVDKTLTWWHLMKKCFCFITWFPQKFSASSNLKQITIIGILIKIPDRVYIFTLLWSIDQSHGPHVPVMGCNANQVHERGIQHVLVQANVGGCSDKLHVNSNVTFLFTLLELQFIFIPVYVWIYRRALLHPHLPSCASAQLTHSIVLMWKTKQKNKTKKTPIRDVQCPYIFERYLQYEGQDWGRAAGHQLCKI